MSLVRYESAGHVATITMDRSSAHNALNPALCTELRDAWRRFRDSDDRGWRCWHLPKRPISVSAQT